MNKITLHGSLTLYNSPYFSSNLHEFDWLKIKLMIYRKYNYYRLHLILGSRRFYNGLLPLWAFYFDRAEGYDFWPRLWSFFSPFLFPPRKRGKKKRRMNSKNRDQKSCLSARSIINKSNPNIYFRGLSIDNKYAFNVIIY